MEGWREEERKGERRRARAALTRAIRRDVSNEAIERKERRDAKEKVVAGDGDGWEGRGGSSKGGGSEGMVERRVEERGIERNRRRDACAVGSLRSRR